MDKKEMILTVAKDLYIARVGKDLAMKSLSDAVKIVEEAFNTIKG